MKRIVKTEVFGYHKIGGGKPRIKESFGKFLVRQNQQR
jgi:hypothetical protein